MSRDAPHVGAAQLEAAHGDERARMLEHIDACPSCRHALAEADPAALFGLLALRPIPVAQLDRLSERVEAAIDRESTPAGAGAVRRRFAGIAASLLLAAGFLGYMQRHERRMTVTADSRSHAVTAAHTTPATPTAVSWVAPLDTPRSIEVLETPGTAEIVDFAVGDTQVVMIFDEELDI